jgi:hypothetical protein
MNNEYIINDITKEDLDILDKEGIMFTIMGVTYKKNRDYDTYNIRIEGDKLYYYMALNSIRRM